MKYGLFLILFIQPYLRLGAQPGAGHKTADFPEDKDYTVSHYTSENGLPQNTAHDLLFDEEGYLWIATENGLARFDGQRFRVYNNANTPAIKSSLFAIIFQASEHKIFATTDFQNSTILTITPDHQIREDTAASGIKPKFVNVQSGCIFDGTRLFTHYGSIGLIGMDTLLLNELSRADTFEIINPHEMVACKNGDWYYLDNVSPRVIKLPAGLNRSGNQSFCLDGQFCVFGSGKGLRTFRKGKETTVTIDRSVLDLVRAAKIPWGPQFQLFRKGELVLIRVGDDIYQLRLDGQVLKAGLIFKDLEFLTDQAVLCFQYDSAAQRLFMGTVNAGVFVVTKKNFHTAAFHSQDINNNVVLAFELLPNDKILTSHGVLNEEHTGSSLLFKEANAPDWNCLFKAADHSIWFSRHNHLYQYDSSFSRQLFTDTLGLDSYVTSIQEDRNHVLWISSTSSLLKIENGHLRYLEHHNPLFVGHRIQATAQVVPGEWWIATSNGLYAYDMVAGKTIDRPLLPGVYVRSIYTAKDGSIWLGTYGDGYYKYAAGKFIALPLDSRQYLATAHTFLEDREGFFWISTDHGLFRIRKKDLDDQNGTGHKGLFFYCFDKSAGLNTAEFNGGCNPSSLIDGKGNFYIPSMDGLLHFNPDSIRCEWPDKPILIDHVSLDSSNLDNKQPLMISPEFNQLAIDITTPFYGSEANLQLEYKLNSVGEQWYPVGKEGRIYVNRLPYGKYALMIRKRNGWGPGEYSVSSFSFEVLPRWYNTRGFDFLLFGFILLALLLFYLFRPRILMRQNRRLQAKVDLRTAELEQSTIIKERLISAIMHDLRSPLFAQGNLIGYMERNHPKMKAAEMGDLLVELNESNKRICQFSTDFLAWYNTRLEGFQLELYPVELAPFVRQVAAFYLELAGRKGLSFTVDIPQDVFLRTDRNILAIVLRNLVDNAVKYTATGRIHISSFVREGELRISVEDTGAGIPASKIDELLNYGQVNTHKSSSTYGYRLIIELTQLIKAGLNIESETGKGTTVALSFRT